MTSAQIRATLALLGQPPSPEKAVSLGKEHDGFAEGFFHQLGARVVDSLDVSPFEGSTIVQDLNEPIRRGTHQRFSTVVDGGTLEHIFNFPVALSNAMDLVQQDGHLIIMAASNGLSGHGFYQFSPETFFRAFAPENGFTVDLVLVVEQRRRGRWFRIEDGAIYGHRVEPATRGPTVVFALGRRTSIATEPLGKAPQQSDYALAWTKEGRRLPASAIGKRSPMTSLKNCLRPLYQGRLGTPAIRRVSPRKLIRKG
jgi:hypothetical protein